MGFPSTAVLTTFAGADENPVSEGRIWPGNADSDHGDLQLLSNRAAGTAVAAGSMYWPVTFDANCEAFCTMTVKPAANRSVGFILRITGAGTATPDGYVVLFATSTPDVMTTYRMDDGVLTSLGSDNITLTNGDVLGARITGNVIQGYQNGVPVGSGRVDNTYTTGSKIALFINDTTTRVSSFGGGSYNASGGGGKARKRLRNTWHRKTPTSGAAAVTMISNVTYSGSLQCDIYRTTQTSRPAIIVLHGGAWNTVPATRNSASFYGNISRVFASYGYVAINADFTPANGSPQDAIDDILDLVTWVRANAATYGIDATKVACMGVSSGGHAALMAGIQGTPGGSRPDCVIGWSPVTDMEDSYTYVPTEMTNVFGVTLPGNEALYRSFSPTDVVTSNCCPIRIVGSNAEETDVGSVGPPVTQFTDMKTNAEAVSVVVGMRIFAGTVHGLFDGITADNGTIGPDDRPAVCAYVAATLGA